MENALQCGTDNWCFTDPQSIASGTTCRSFSSGHSEWSPNQQLLYSISVVLYASLKTESKKIMAKATYYMMVVRYYSNSKWSHQDRVKRIEKLQQASPRRWRAGRVDEMQVIDTVWDVIALAESSTVIAFLATVSASTFYVSSRSRC